MRSRLVASAAVVAMTALVLSGCSPSEDAEPSASPSPSVPAVDLTAYASMDEAVLAGARTSNTALLTAALDAGGDIEAYDETNGYSALIFAALRNDAETAQLLIDRGAALYDESTGYLPLAFPTGSAVTQVMVDAGAPVDGFGDVYGSPVMSAAYLGYADVLAVLLEAGADPNVEWDGQGPDGGTITPVMAAVFNYSEDAVRVLLEYGADPTVVAPDGSTVLEWAEFRNLPEIAELLRSYGAS